MPLENESQVSPPFRVGHGYDIHRLQESGRLMLAGVKVADGLSAIAHSDGDVVAHAVVDAMLGAMGLADIGEHFPNTDPRWRQASSRIFVESVLEQVLALGYRPSNLDITIMAERPRLKPFKKEMIQSMAEMLEMRSTAVNIKAGTNEGCDAIGRGEAIAAHAVVLLWAVR